MKSIAGYQFTLLVAAALAIPGATARAQSDSAAVRAARFIEFAASGDYEAAVDMLAPGTASWMTIDQISNLWNQLGESNGGLDSTTVEATMAGSVQLMGHFESGPHPIVVRLDDELRIVSFRVGTGGR